MSDTANQNPPPRSYDWETDPEYREEAAADGFRRQETEAELGWPPAPDPAAFACPAHDPDFGGDPGLADGCGGCDPAAIASMAGRGTASATPRQDAVLGLLMNRVRQIRMLPPSEYWQSGGSPDWPAMMLAAQVADELAAAPNWETMLALRGVDEPAAPARETGGLSI